MVVNDGAIISPDILSILAGTLSIPVAFGTLSRLKLAVTSTWLI